MSPIIIYLVILLSIHADNLNDIYNFNELHYFPDTIPVFQVRKDPKTNMEVSRGRLQLMKFDASNMIQSKTVNKTSLNRFNEIAQCANPAPELDGNRGSFSMLRMTSITRQSLETACAYLETGCLPYVKCKDYINKSKLNKYDLNYYGTVAEDKNTFKTLILLRIKGNALFYDWPWGNERFQKNHGQYVNKLRDHYLLISMVLSFIKDIGDNFFYFGNEKPSIHWNLNIPLFSFAPKIGSGDLPFPWKEMYLEEFHRNRAATEANNHSDEFYQRYHIPWHERTPKAAFYASFDGASARQIIYDQAAVRSDLFDVQFSVSPFKSIRAWNLASDEEDYINVFTADNKMSIYELNFTTDANYTKPNRNHPGFIQPILKFGRLGGYNPAQYKYVIVPAGTSIESTSGRLSHLLAHSGAVVLLQEAGFSYHFSARLQPWVHYVPLAYNMADATAKIEWLRANDDMAQQIVQNAINFGKSYLRLEDYYCYAANSLHLLAHMQKEGGATEHSTKSALLEAF